MKNFIGIFIATSVTSCTQNINNNSIDSNNRLTDSINTKLVSCYGMLVNSGTLSNKCFDSISNVIKYSVCFYDDDKYKFIVTNDNKFITLDSVSVGMKYGEVILISKNNLIKEPGFAYYFPLKSGWFAAFNLDAKTNCQTITKDYSVFYFR